MNCTGVNQLKGLGKKRTALRWQGRGSPLAGAMCCDLVLDQKDANQLVNWPTRRVFMGCHQEYVFLLSLIRKNHSEQTTR